jgi:hypothetical protein
MGQWIEMCLNKTLTKKLILNWSGLMGEVKREILEVQIRITTQLNRCKELKITPDFRLRWKASV